MSDSFTTYVAFVLDIETGEMHAAGMHSTKPLAIHAALLKMSEVNRPEELLLTSVYDINSNLVSSDK